MKSLRQHDRRHSAVNRLDSDGGDALIGFNPTIVFFGQAAGASQYRTRRFQPLPGRRSGSTDTSPAGNELTKSGNVTSFEPRLDVLPPPQRRLWPELAGTPSHFTLYGETALALRLGHRSSVDFDFFSRAPFDPDRLAAAIPYLAGSERVQVDIDTLTCRVDRGGPILVSFFGKLGIGQVSASEEAGALSLRVASLMDLAGTKVALVQKRAQGKDYVDIDALIGHGGAASKTATTG